MKSETKQILRLFIEKALELKSSRLIQLIRQDSLKITMSFEGGDSGNMRMEYSDIDREALQAFALTFRMFAEQRDDIALRKLPNLNDKDLSDRWRNAVAQVNQWYSQYIADTSSPTFVIDGEHLSRVCYRTENPFATCGAKAGSIGNRKLT